MTPSEETYFFQLLDEMPPKAPVYCVYPQRNTNFKYFFFHSFLN